MNTLFTPGNTIMKALLTLLFVLTLTAAIFTQTANGQVTVAGSAGSANGTYTTLKLAFDALNLVTQTQTGKNIVVTITASTIETAAAVLNVPRIGVWTSLKIYPTVTGLSITGNLATPLIDLNGADNVTIDGRVNQSGAKDLIITNTSAAYAMGTSTIRFYNDASSNTVKYCTIKGSTTDAGAGIVFFSNTNGITGNDNNIIDNNDITSSADDNRPFHGIYSNGATAIENNGLTISNNNIYDFLNRGLASKGINLFSFTTACTITGNSFYETTNFAPTAAVSYYAIYISNASGTNFTVSGNYIGGNAASCGGADGWRKSNAYGNSFYGIYISVGPPVASNVQGNTIANFNYSDPVNTVSWKGIYATGNVNIGTTSGNTIGNASTTGSIKYNCSATGGNIYGIYLEAFTGKAQNNTIASITASNTNGAMATNFTGIYLTGISPCNVSNNTIGSTTVANSVNASSASTGNAQAVYGISRAATSSATISGNTIANLTNGTTNSTTSTTGLIYGISATAGSNVITNNVVRDLTIANAFSSESVIGIYLRISSVGNVQTITGNTIYNLSNTNASSPVIINGIYYSGSLTPATLSGNFIHSLSLNDANSASSALFGIRMNGGAVTCSNNIINLVSSTQANIYGIHLSGSSGAKNNLFFNTVFIGGTPASGTSMSYALYSFSNTDIRDFRNNIFSNVRSTTGGSNLHYAAYFNNGANTNLTLDNNDYYAPGTGGVLGGYYNSGYFYVTSLPLISGKDANSLAINPSFASAGGTTALNYYPSASLPAVAGTATLVDYSNFARNATPKMGAVEFTSAPAPSGNTVAVYNGAALQASYPDIKDAFAKINDGTHTGSIIVKINGSQLLSSSAILNASGTGSASYTAVTLYPTTTGITISGSGSFTEPLIDLNGADNVVIDGRVGGTGSTKDLIITNPGIAGSTIRFINDATGNTVKYCTIKGSSTDPNGGIIYFSTTTGTTGNDNNLIDNNDITNALDANRPLNAIYSFGTGTGNENSANTISNNNIYDFLNRGLASFGINLSSNTTAWTISGNSFYESASFVPTAGVEYRVINIDNTTNGQNFTVSNNFIGGSAASCGGNAWTKTNAFPNTFYGINISAGTAIASNIQGNTIKNIAYANETSSAFWYGIKVAEGIVNIGTTAGNTIGAATGTGSITYTSETNDNCIYGILTSSQAIIQNNIIGSIVVANPTNTKNTNFVGIQCTGYNANVKNNLIGSTDTPNSINVTSTSTTMSQTVFGIFSPVSGSITITGNTIANLTNGTTNTNISDIGRINGIYFYNGSNTVTNNIVHDLTIANANNLLTYQASVGGIVFYYTTEGKVQTITGNTIYNLSNTYASFTGSVVGLYYQGSVTPATVSGNFIHSLSVNTGSTAANIFGVKIDGGASTYANNIINLGGDTKTNIYGIYENGAANNNNNLYFNTVYVSGTLASGPTNTSFALYSAVATNTRDIRNNIFSNARSTAGGASLHFAAYFASNGGVLNCNYNDYFVSGTGGKLGFYGGDKTSLPIVSGVTGNDANSSATDPSFASAGGTAALNYYPSASLPAVAGTGLLVDYNNNTRNATPKMGAIESASVVNAVDVYVGGTLISSFSNIKTAFDKINVGTYTGVITLKITGSQELTITASLNASGIGNANYTSVTIYPTTTGLTISGNIPAPLIDLNGADNVVLDGRVNATGSAKDLTITNTSISSQTGTSTIRFINDASSNTVKYCKVKGSSMATDGGIIYFAATSGTTGNDNNLIDNNDITNALDANRPLNAAYSSGNTQLGLENSNNTISNNNIFDFFNRGTASFGVYFNTGSTVWTLSGNSFYETASFIPTASCTYYIIRINASAGQDFTVSNNYMGGSAALCDGTAWTKTNAFSNAFYAIYVNIGTITASNIQGNVIKNFNFSNSLNDGWTAISCSNGNINVGTTTGNIIGSPTGNSSITLTNSTTGGAFYGIVMQSSIIVDVRNNSIGSITTANTDATALTSIIAMYLPVSNPAVVVCRNNLIGSTDAGTSNSLNASSLSTGVAQSVYGIYCTGGNVLPISGTTISGNTISKLTNATTFTTGTLKGIYSGNAYGINISNNFITNLSATEATGKTVYGISLLNGINTLANNIISLGGTSSNTVMGISESGTAGTEFNMYFNTVYIGGILGSGVTNKSYALYSELATSNRDYRNNIFSNARSTTDGASLHYAAFFNYVVNTNLTLSNNDYYAPGTGAVLGYYNNLNVTGVPLISGIDATSLSLNPLFASAGGSTATDYLPSASSLVAATGTGITADYSATERSASYPAMGALEFTVSVPTVTEKLPGTNGINFRHYPNPFAGPTLLNYTLPYTGIVTVVVRNLSGEIVKTVVSGNQPEGNYSFTLADDLLKPGIYIATLKLKGNGIELTENIKLVKVR